MAGRPRGNRPDVTGSGTPVLPGWRPLVWAFLALTLLSTVTLYVLPERTDRLFAWTIQPPLSAAFLGGGYAAGFVLVVFTMRARAWADARVPWATVCVFTWATLVATLAHLDRFHFDAAGAMPRFLAWLWIVVYVTVPPWMTVLLIGQRRARAAAVDAGADNGAGPPLPRWLAAALGVQAAVLAGVGVALLVAPTLSGSLWPWTLTPLVSRAVGAWCLALGFAAALVVQQGDFAHLRAPSLTYVCLGLLQAGALARYADEVAWGTPAAWAYLAVLGAITATGAYGWTAGRRGSPAAEPAPA
jgi:hypothetical protein